MSEELDPTVADQVMNEPAPHGDNAQTTQPEPHQTHNAETAKNETGADETEAKEGTDWKAEARKWESRSKENLANLEKAQEQLKSVGNSAEELVALREQVDTLVQENAQAKREAAVANVIADKGLTPVQASLLQGETAEELAKHADALLAAFGTSTEQEETTPGTSRTTREKLHPGSSNSAAPAPEDMGAVADAVLKGGF